MVYYISLSLLSCELGMWVTYGPVTYILYQLINVLEYILDISRILITRYHTRYSKFEVKTSGRLESHIKHP